MTEPEETQSGVPAANRIRREYTMSDAALAQRRQASLSARDHATGPVTPEGKAASSRNGWKHGLYASTIASRLGKPCRSTCPDFAECELVAGGTTAPGGQCMDKQAFVQTFQAIAEALEEGKMEKLQALFASHASLNLEILRAIQLAILEDGATVKEEMFDKDGHLLGYKIKGHPNLPDLARLTAALKLDVSELKLSPKSREENKESGAASTLAEALAGVAKALGGGK